MYDFLSQENSQNVRKSKIGTIEHDVRKEEAGEEIITITKRENRQNIQIKVRPSKLLSGDF